MKTCALCHTEAADDAPTCASCGEATWTAAPTTPKPPPSEPEPQDPESGITPEESRVKPRKRSR